MLILKHDKDIVNLIYFIKNKYTLRNNINTKHIVHNCDKCCAQFKPPMKLLKHMAVCQKRGMKDESYYVEYCFSCKTKKSPKSHD